MGKKALASIVKTADTAGQLEGAGPLRVAGYGDFERCQLPERVLDLGRKLDVAGGLESGLEVPD